jgi:NAD(P)-dependent dehydrogenase (short-subunit alcohol dehydrogenase family)
MSLEGRVAVVTGGAGGIGQATAIRLAGAGARVVLIDLRREACDETLDLIARAGGPEATAIGVDVASERDVSTAFDEIERSHGPVELLVTPAAVLTPNVPAEEAQADDLQRAWSVNVNGTFFCAQAAARQMIPRRYGRIVTLASQAALLSLPSQSVYTATKGAVAALTRSLAIDWAQHGIRVNSVAPTFTATPMTKQMLENPTVSETVLKRIPLGRVAEPSDIADVIHFLLSDASSMITGHVLPIDGGWTAGEAHLDL